MVDVTVTVHDAQRGEEKAVLGRVIVSPLSEEAVIDIMEGLGNACGLLFPEKFQHAQIVAITPLAGPHSVGVLLAFAPFEDKVMATEYMGAVAEVLREKLTEPDFVFDAPAAVQ